MSDCDSAAGGHGDVKVFADRADRAGLDLVVTRNGGDPLALGSTDGPAAVPGAFAQRIGAVLSQVALQLASFFTLRSSARASRCRPAQTVRAGLRT
jgi:hypothetical protein